MSAYNFDHKTFTLLENSAKGSASATTIFKYRQDGNLVTADYQGGAIRYGKIIARLEGEKLHMLYQCMTEAGDLKAGRAIADISMTADQKIRLQLNWEWLGEEEGKGVSEYVEV